jgi:hypothetical protein
MLGVLFTLFLLLCVVVFLPTVIRLWKKNALVPFRSWKAEVRNAFNEKVN